MASEPPSLGCRDDLQDVGSTCNKMEDCEDGAEDLLMEDPTGGSSSVNMPTFKLPAKISRMLYPHQRQGLSWLWFLLCMGTGGILGDDMGRTWQDHICAFLAGLFQSGLIRRVLVVVTETLVTHWIKELTVVGLESKISNYSGPNVNVRNSELQCAFKGGVLLTTYDIVRINYKLLRGDFYNDADDDEEGNLWNYVILDEAHFMKNPETQRFRSIFEIPCVHRIAISATPIQNNLKELWALFYFCCPEVLGDMNEFRKPYEYAINRGNEKDATNREKHIGSNVAMELRERIQPYFFRRMKGNVSLDTGSKNDKMLPKKNELTIWLKLTECQRQLYEAFLNSDMLSTMRPPCTPHITILKKICDHPLVLTKRAAEGILEDMEGTLNDQDTVRLEKMALNLAGMANDDDDNYDALQVGQEFSCKFSFIKSLLRKLLEEGHLVKEDISLEGYKFFRIDGTTEISERERIVKVFDFQEGFGGTQIFLLTTKVGGLGLTLTKADRVIVVDPAWNPSVDNQSVDRGYRIGQTKDVIVYRLMTSGTVDEKIYRMQVFKGGLFRTATEQKEQTRYFNKRDIQDLFSLPAQGFDISLTQKQLQKEHGQQLDTDESLRKHIECLEQQGIAGVSHHNLLFSKTEVLPTLSDDDHALGNRDARAVKENSECPPEEVNRLTQTLANTTLVLRLPDHDRGDKAVWMIARRRSLNRNDPLSRCLFWLRAS